MPVCKECGDEVAKVKTARVNGRSVKVCEDCKGRLAEEAEIAEAGEAAMQNMMGYKGRR